MSCLFVSITDYKSACFKKNKIIAYIFLFSFVGLNSNVLFIIGHTYIISITPYDTKMNGTYNYWKF